MSDTSVAQIFVNFSKRKITIMDDEGYEKEVQWKWDKEGSEGFTETVHAIQDTVDVDLITYCFAVK
ncbi:hypothetical protein RW03080701_020 [Synechococcus phage S-RIM8]|uniref:Gp21 n=2 Tax=Neptunevirus srim18 TaxID=2734121 RepID=A0A1D7S960_9CAUD|nr:gp21 [Synechococcus phage S-RIM8 A.HR1]YP_009782932.1 hypothetical protein HOQ82_gp222 [Synechococcus phage S-RIM8]AFB15304.1 gp21 [Synechococcus phage S-RIM8 A.HR5]AFB17731.1 gp21 [Synechococcus phage S-RIM8 A.HR3]AGH57805.1 hypothetical protein CPJG_00053 [Synechococcus phage KBS-M-1A]AFB17520.1 gp21 [Synechococcus phage S-RIM8 A.HR1]AOO10172.1 hypothetical protein RW01021201_020 [Synechococcus phage S-RIM8]